MLLRMRFLGTWENVVVTSHNLNVPKTNVFLTLLKICCNKSIECSCDIIKEMLQ